MAQNPIVGLIAQRVAAYNQSHPQRRVDLRAALAVAAQEGLSGAVGDNGTSFGPWQLHQGGALPSSVGLAQGQQWASSPQGIDYALGRIGGVAGGLQGQQAVNAIVSRFERPANPGKEIASALAAYGSVPTGGYQAPPADPLAAAAAAPPAATDTRRQFATQLLAGISPTGQLNQDSLVAALAQRRQAMQAAPAAAPAQGVPGAPPTAPAASAPTGKFTPGAPVADLTSEGGLHPTEGLDGYPAHDYFAPAGSPAVAPVAGKVVRLSGHDPSQGPIDGPHGPLGWSVYIQGNDGRTYYLTHMGSRAVKVGETVKAGTVIGTVADYAKYGTPSHIHMGVH